MSLQMLVRCKRCGKPLTRYNVSIVDMELCRECEKKELMEEEKLAEGLKLLIRNLEIES